MNLIKSIHEARQLLDDGHIIAYPTEAVYGLGCNPFNQTAVQKLLQLKNRSVAKGLIILISDWMQLWPLIGDVPDAALEAVKKTWPGPRTWIFPKSDVVPSWLTGSHHGIAIRMTAHVIARALCVDGPIVSTSANLSGGEPMRDMNALKALFPEGVSGVLAGDLGQACGVSEIYNVLDGAQIRGV